MITKELGKIEKVSFGYGGYQDAQFGLNVQLSFGGCGTCVFIDGGWSEDVKVTSNTKWTERDRQIQRAEMVKKINKLLQDAKACTIDQLKDKPVEVTSENMRVKDWRILTEVI
jgi:hypothetical protein